MSNKNAVQLSQTVGLIKVITPGPRGPAGPNGGISAEEVQAILDVPIRINPQVVSANYVIPAGFNANSVGPLRIAEEVTVTVSDTAKWSIT